VNNADHESAPPPSRDHPAIIRGQTMLQRDTSCGERLIQHSVFSECHELVQRFLWRFALIIRCHQLPERSFCFRNRQVPVCARCLGILLGVFAVPFYIHDLRIAVALILAMIIDAGTQGIGLRSSRNWLRFATGFGCSLGFGGLIERGIHHLWNM
jgi:uncharacterized membrane protein